MTVTFKFIEKEVLSVDQFKTLKFKSVQDLEMQDKIQEIHNEAIDTLLKNKPELVEHKYLLFKPLFVELSDKMRSCAGRAKGGYLVKINYKLHQENPNELKSTYVHELAHIVCQRLFPTQRIGHGPKWKKIMELMEEEATRTHDMKTSHLKRKREKFLYLCSCEKPNHEVGAKIHKNISVYKRKYTCRRCKCELSFSKELGRV